MINDLKRPIFRYFGGKWRIAPWIISHFPKHRVYVEPFAGGASVLMRKKRSYSEVYNDLNSEIVNVFRVLRNPDQARRLEELLRLTPWSREEFVESYESAEDPIEQARRTLFRSAAGFGSSAATRKYSTGFRSNVFKTGKTPFSDWSYYPELIKSFTERLSGVVIENRNAIEVIGVHDSPETLFYIDPPYVLDTRTKTDAYGDYEMSDEDHVGLSEVLNQVEGFVVLSGYDSHLYDSLYSSWTKLSKTVAKSSNKASVSATEVLYLNPRTSRQQRQRSLFE